MKKLALLCFFILFSAVGVILQITSIGSILPTISEANIKLVVSHNFFFNEELMAKRIALTAQQLGIDCLIVGEHNYSWVKRIFPNYSQFLLGRFKPEIVLSLHTGDMLYDKGQNYLAMTHNSDYYFQSHLSMQSENLIKFDGFLTSFPDTFRLSNLLNTYRESKRSIQWYPSCAKTDFVASSKRRLFYCGSNLIKTAYGDKYRRVFSQLDKNNYLRVYGKKSNWNHTPNGYRGLIKRDAYNIVNTMRRYGITLILHSPDEFIGKTPSQRIFEACAASTVLICDKHPFVEKEFQNSVLYVDTSLSPHEIYQQIDSHIQWIRNHPEEAHQLARQSHEIFINKFTLEEQISSLLKFHEEIKHHN